MAKAREEFESWESQNNKHEDLDDDEQQNFEDGAPAGAPEKKMRRELCGVDLDEPDFCWISRSPQKCGCMQGVAFKVYDLQRLHARRRP